MHMITQLNSYAAVACNILMIKTYEYDLTIFKSFAVDLVLQARNMD